MPLLKFARDKRGYEHFYLVEPVYGRRGKTRQRLLYWFRTPPGVKVGRQAFDDRVKREIEAQNPQVTFDWVKLLDTPIPPPAPDVERWRERRREARSSASGSAGNDSEPRRPAVEPIAPQRDAVAELAPSSNSPGETAGAVATSPQGPLQTRARKRRRRGRRNRRSGNAPGISTPAESSEGAPSSEGEPLVEGPGMDEGGDEGD